MPMLQRWKVDMKWKLRTWQYHLNILKRRRMAKIRRCYDEAWAKNTENEGHVFFGEPDNNIHDLCHYFSAMHEEDWGALDSLLARPWWSRTWVVQEIWNASDAVLQCGSVTLKWKTFAKAFDYDEA